MSEATDLPANARLRVLVIAPSAELYGSDRTLLYSLRDLAGMLEVSAIFAMDGPVVDGVRALGVDAYVVPDFALRSRNVSARGFFPWLWRSTRSVSFVVRMHRREPFDLIFTNTLASWIGGVLSVLLRRPQLLHVKEYPYQRSWYPTVLFGWARMTADVIICNSHYTKSRIIESAPALASRSRVVYNGIELPVPSRPKTSSERLRVACVARIHPKKGQWVLVEAAVRAKEEGHDWELHFYGDALPEHHYILDRLRARVAQTGLDATFHGFVTETVELYLDADVAVVPSIVPEEFSLVCVEAQAMQTPVVATGPGGPSEVLEDGVTGLVVPPDNAEALKDAIISLEQDPERRAVMGQAGRLRAKDLFSREVFARRIAEECEALIDRNRVPRRDRRPVSNGPGPLRET